MTLSVPSLVKLIIIESYKGVSDVESVLLQLHMHVKLSVVYVVLDIRDVGKQPSDC